MLQPATIKFLVDLKVNNNKAWFDAHRKAYESARDDFASFINAVIQQFGKKETAISHLKAKDCLFRINRDIRFSKDKIPYKTNFGAYINEDGKKSVKAGYYFHFEPGGSFTGGGMWMPMPEQLNKVRQEIDYNLVAFEKIMNTKKFKELFKRLSVEEGQVLSRVPKGYEADNPAAAYLKFKSFVALTTISDKDLTGGGLLKKTVEAFSTIQPFIKFLNEGLGE